MTYDKNATKLAMNYEEGFVRPFDCFEDSIELKICIIT